MGGTPGLRGGPARSGAPPPESADPFVIQSPLVPPPAAERGVSIRDSGDTGPLGKVTLPFCTPTASCTKRRKGRRALLHSGLPILFRKTKGRPPGLTAHVHIDPFPLGRRAHTVDFLEDATGEPRLVGTRCLVWPSLVGNGLSSVARPGEPGPSPRAFQ